MHVALNALFLEPGRTGGMELVVRRLVPALLAQDPELRVTLFVHREGEAVARALIPVDRGEVRVLPGSATSRIRRSILEQLVLPPAVARSGAELLHNLGSTAPAWSPVRQVTTIHDLTFRHARAHTRVLQWGIGRLVALAARVSARVLTVSRYVADDIHAVYGIPTRRLDVVWNGPGLDPEVEPVDEAELRARIGDGPFLLTPASPRPHKNLPRLLRAFARVPGEPRLVLTGADSEWRPELEGDIRRLGLEGRVRLLGWVDPPVLAALYAHATALVLPSLAEGFGLPVLEAMGRGCPVVCSDRTSLPQVAGDAAVYFDPADERGMADAIGRVLRDEALRARLVAAGTERARRFGWEATARATLEAYRRALGEG